MKSSIPELRALLATRRFAMADLYLIEPLHGDAMRYCGADKSLTWDGHVWSARGPILQRGATRLVRGVEADTLKVTIAPRQDSAVLQQARSGLFDSATLTLYRAFMPNWESPVTGVVHLFSGTVNDVEVSREEAVLNVKSALQLLDTKIPRTLYNPGCTYTVFDGSCGLSAAAYAVTATLQVGTKAGVLATDLTVARGAYDLGTVVFETGVNAGEVRSIRHSWATGQLVLSYPLPQAPAPGDQIVVYPGCDGSIATCRDKYANLARYGGTPFVPSPETAH